MCGRKEWMQCLYDSIMMILRNRGQMRRLRLMRVGEKTPRPTCFYILVQRRFVRFGLNMGPHIAEVNMRYSTAAWNAVEFFFLERSWSEPSVGSIGLKISRDLRFLHQRCHGVRLHFFCLWCPLLYPFHAFSSALARLFHRTDAQRCWQRTHLPNQVFPLLRLPLIYKNEHGKRNQEKGGKTKKELHRKRKSEKKRKKRRFQKARDSGREAKRPLFIVDLFTPSHQRQQQSLATK